MAEVVSRPCYQQPFELWNLIFSNQQTSWRQNVHLILLNFLLKIVKYLGAFQFARFRISMCTWCQLFCALCRIGCYKWCHKSVVSRPEYTIIAVGLTRAGKSTLLATLCNEDASDIQPTQGFSIKALQFPEAILNVKELGGNVERYWGHYFGGVQGIVFVVDSSDSGHLEEAAYCLAKVLSSPFLKGLPLLVLANKQDVENAKDLGQITDILNLHVVAQNFNWTIHGCSSKDKGSIETGLTMLIEKLEPDLPPEDNRI